jgi:Flp pilus assembly protein TadD
MRASLLFVFATLTGIAAGQECAAAPGRAAFYDGEFRKAAAQFELALQDSPDDAVLHYWAGRSYEVLADIAAPLDRKNRSKARRHLSRAFELGPANPEYRRELFHFLVESGDFREAAAILCAAGESDPEYGTMRRELDRGRRANSSAEARLGWVFLAVPRAAYGLAQAPVW